MNFWNNIGNHNISFTSPTTQFVSFIITMYIYFEYVYRTIKLSVWLFLATLQVQIMCYSQLVSIRPQIQGRTTMLEEQEIGAMQYERIHVRRALQLTALFRDMI